VTVWFDELLLTTYQKKEDEIFYVVFGKHVIFNFRIIIMDCVVLKFFEKYFQLRNCEWVYLFGQIHLGFACAFT